MKKNKNVEMCIYELLGVNIFRKYILFTWEKIAKLIKLNVEYRIDKLNIEGLNNYKKNIISFAMVHSILLFFIFVQSIISHKALSYNLFNILLNSYCVMTQRYNYIRINQLIKKMTSRYERQKNEIEEEPKKDNSLPLVHTHTIVYKKEGETSMLLDDLIANANIEQLKQYREYLAHFQSINQSTQGSAEHQVDVSMPMGKHK